MRVIRDEHGVTYVAPGVLLPEEKALLAAARRSPLRPVAARAVLAAALNDLDASMAALKRAQQPYSAGVALARRYGYLD